MLNQLLREQLSEHNAATPEQKLEALKRAAEVEEFTVKLEVIRSEDETPPQSVCHEYVSSTLQIGARLAPSLKKFTINLVGKQYAEPHTCKYNIDKGLFTQQDGSPVPKAEPALETIQINSADALTVASFSLTRTSFTPFPVLDVLIPSLYVSSDIPKLAAFLTKAAEQLYKKSAFQDVIIRFLAVQGDTLHYFKLPAYPVMAFKGASNEVVLVEQIKFQVTALQPEGGEREVNQFVLVQALNANLLQAVTLGEADDAYKAYMRDGVYQDATRVLEAIGRFAADAFQVSKVVVSSAAPIPGSGLGINIPVMFQRDGTGWKITNRAESGSSDRDI